MMDSISKMDTNSVISSEKNEDNHNKVSFCKQVATESAIQIKRNPLAMAMIRECFAYPMDAKYPEINKLNPINKKDGAKQNSALCVYANNSA